jgi:hypothetical protein
MPRTNNDSGDDHENWPSTGFFPCESLGKTVFGGLMKIPYLPIVVMAGALSLASANAMPDLGRETGKFIRKDESVPKDVKTFEPARTNASKADLAILVPINPNPSKADLAILVPINPNPSKTDLAILVPINPNPPNPSKADLAILVPINPNPSKG